MPDGQLPIFLEGIYRSFAEVPDQTGYNSDEYLRGLLLYCEEQADALKAGTFPHAVQRNIQSNVLIAVIASMLPRRRKLRILDFGGGMGQTFVAVAAAIPDYARHISYVVCDLPDTISYIRANDIYRARGIKGIQFIDHLKQAGHCDLVYIGSTLQYLPSWRETAGELIRLRPTRILLTQTPSIVRAPSVVIAQPNAPGGTHPAWIFGLDELIRMFTESRYEFIAGTSEFQGDRTRDLSYLPPEYRDYRSAVLHFRRKSLMQRR